jgi:hypothetical protein
MSLMRPIDGGNASHDGFCAKFAPTRHRTRRRVTRPSGIGASVMPRGYRLHVK